MRPRLIALALGALLQVVIGLVGVSGGWRGEVTTFISANIAALTCLAIFTAERTPQRITAASCIGASVLVFASFYWNPELYGNVWGNALQPLVAAVGIMFYASTVPLRAGPLVAAGAFILQAALWPMLVTKLVVDPASYTLGIHLLDLVAAFGCVAWFAQEIQAARPLHAPKPASA